jgi:hypothetical protein
LLSGEPTPFPLFKALSKSLTLRGFIYSEIVADVHRLATAESFILKGLSSGALNRIIARTLIFDQIVEAHRYLKSNEQTRKIVVTTRRSAGANTAHRHARLLGPSEPMRTINPTRNPSFVRVADAV